MCVKDKRAEIHGRITAYQAQIAQAKHDLAHINASIRLFTDICVRHLEVDGELTTRDLAERVMIERRLDATDATLRNSVVFKVVQALRHAARRKHVRMVEKRKGMCVWAPGDAVTLRVVASRCWHPIPVRSGLKSLAPGEPSIDIEVGRADTMTSAHVCGCHASFLFSQDRDDLFLGEFAFAHCLSPLRQTLHSNAGPNGYQVTLYECIPYASKWAVGRPMRGRQKSVCLHTVWTRAEISCIRVGNSR